MLSLYSSKVKTVWLPEPALSDNWPDHLPTTLAQTKWYVVRRSHTQCYSFLTVLPKALIGQGKISHDSIGYDKAWSCQIHPLLIPCARSKRLATEVYLFLVSCVVMCQCVFVWSTVTKIWIIVGLEFDGFGAQYARTIKLHSDLIPELCAVKIPGSTSLWDQELLAPRTSVIQGSLMPELSGIRAL